MRSLLETARQPMSVVDTAWLRMDTADNLMVINGVMEFENTLSHADLVRLLADRLVVKAPRFGMRPVCDQGQYFWEKMPALDWSYHASILPLPEGAPGEPHSDQQLQEICGHVVAETLEAGRPLWRFYLIESFRGGSALVFKVHHSYADGIALISTLDAIADQSVLHSSPAARAGFKAPAAKGDAWHHRVQHALTQSVFYTGFAAAWLFEAMRVALMPADSKTAFKQALSAEKRVAWAPSLPIDEVKRVGRAMGGTVNDVVMACAAGSLRRFLAAAGQPVDGVCVRATVPVNLRPLSEAMDLGNCFGLVYLSLPVAQATAEARVQAVQKSMKGLKNGAQAMMSYGVLSILGFFPTAVQRLALNFFSSKASAVMTNVPGPTEQVSLMGAKVKRSMFWVPQSGGIGIGISILSYAHKVEFGVVADTSLVKDPQVLVDGFVAEFEALRQGLVTQELQGAKSCAV
jgi:diacylglycerol O-acyltransferase